MTSTFIETDAPLQLDYLPMTIVDREEERANLAPLVDSNKNSQQTLYLHGPNGTGKSHLTMLALSELPDNELQCYIPCTRYDTEYKILQQLCQTLTDTEMAGGYHTSDLQRKVEEHVGIRELTIVLDDIEFLLMNGGDDLLYFLSRMDHSNSVNIVMTSSSYTEISTQLEERTYSGLHPLRVPFESYSADELYRILAERARESFGPRSVHTAALTYIASATTNAALAITWLRLAAKTASDKITERTVEAVKDSVRDAYAASRLGEFSTHHRVLYQSVIDLYEEADSSVTSGEIYQQYQTAIADFDSEQLSTRRISDFLKHLEHLNLIQVDYHYGGRQGKTRELKPTNYSDL